MNVHGPDVGARAAAGVGHGETCRHRPIAANAACRGQPAGLERGVRQAEAERVQRVVAAALPEAGGGQQVEELWLVAERGRGSAVEVPARCRGVGWTAHRQLTTWVDLSEDDV